MEDDKTTKVGRSDPHPPNLGGKERIDDFQKILENGISFGRGGERQGQEEAVHHRCPWLRLSPSESQVPRTTGQPQTPLTFVNNGQRCLIAAFFAYSMQIISYFCIKRMDILEEKQ